VIKMAKVDGPLFSLEAKGKIGDAIVFFPWKGRHAVRRWLKPTNPRDIDQKLVRQKMASFGKCLKAISTPSTALPNGADIVFTVKALTPAAQIWNAYLVKIGMQDLYVDGAWTAMMAGVLATDVSNGWVSGAEALGLTTLPSTADGYASDIPAWQQLVAAAYSCWKMGANFCAVDMSVNPSEMVLADVTLFASAFTVAH
jgi:hypothetical protein